MLRHNTGHIIRMGLRGAVIGLLSMVLFISCAKVEPTKELVPIRWDVTSADDKTNSTDTKALIDSYLNLRDACTQDEDGFDKIGLFGTYTLDGKTESLFNNDDLWWWEKKDGNPFNDQLGEQSYWNYEGEGKYWEPGADYLFRAYFPKSLVTLQPGSNAERFLIVYDTQKSQFDMMVASRALRSGSENPVKLEFHHSLAAIRFDFQFIENGIHDRLTACWLENATSDGMYTSSTLNYEDTILWPASTPNPAGSRMYYWEPVDPMIIESSKASTAYTSFSLTGNGELYSGNEGWILTIPQSLKGPETVKLCFKTMTGGNEIFSAGLPAGTLEAGMRHTFHIKISSTSIDLKLTITDWNERKSSHHIDLNE